MLSDSQLGFEASCPAFPLTFGSAGVYLLSFFLYRLGVMVNL
jgi:hypothetical protein